ncbi:MAG: hypothetical protein H7331_07945 [Bacteroidia bacterium]|nr:hypothetical protein [Bacteroidia bacterium]
MPIAIITSSVKKKITLYKLHDIVTNMNILPGIYTPKYTLAADVGIGLLLFRKTHYTTKIHNADSLFTNPKHHRLTQSAGVVLGLNVNRFSFVVKLGFQQINKLEFNKLPFYGFGILGINLNFKKHPEEIKTE